MFDRFKAKIGKKQQKEEQRDLAAELRKAAYSGQLEQVRALLKKCNRDPQIVNQPETEKIKGVKTPGATALIHAARQGHIEVVRELLAVEGIDVNAIDKLQPVISMRGAGDAHFTPGLLSDQDYWHNTALHAAAIRKHVEIVKLLAAMPDVDVNAKCLSGKTPLMCVVEYCPQVLPDILKCKGLLVNEQDNKGRTTLHLACLRRNPYDETLPDYIKLLLKIPGINCSMPDGEGRTVLMVALERRDHVLQAELDRAGARIIEPASQNHTTMSIR